jgi:hypothetical protein
MKFLCQRTLALLVVSSAFILGASSCKKSNNNSTNNNAQLSASVNGSSWANSFPLGAVYSVGASNFQILGIQLKGGDSTGLGLVFLAPITVNQMISSDSGWVDVEYVNSDTIFDGGHTAGHSALTVTSYDPADGKIAGTFSGVLYNVSGGTDSLIVANGSFNTSYTSQ